MKRLALSSALMLLAGTAFAKPGVATSTVNLRAEANTTSEVLAKIPGGGRVDVGECKDGWCAVTFQGKNGFSIETSLDASGKPRRVVRRALPPGADPDDDFEPVGAYGPRPPGYVVAPGPGIVYAPGPYYYGYGPYWGGYGYRRWGGYGYRRW
jgi:hypothetical protein